MDLTATIEELVEHERQHQSEDVTLLASTRLKGRGLSVPIILYETRSAFEHKTMVTVRVAVPGTSLIVDTRWEDR